MSLIERSNPRVMAGKAIFTDVSSCVAAVPSPIMATCHGFAWSKPADEWGRSRLEIEVTLESSQFNFTPAVTCGRRPGKNFLTFCSGDLGGPLRARSGHGSYSITSVAKPKTDVGISMPSSFAVFKFTTNSNLLD